MGADNTFGETNFNPNKMKTEHTTEICFNCGASIGLHHYETLQCPKNGVEAPLNKKQEWDQRNTFEDGGLVKLHDAAPELLEALDDLVEVTKNHPNFVQEKVNGNRWKAVSRAIKAIQKATK